MSRRCSLGGKWEVLGCSVHTILPPRSLSPVFPPATKLTKLTDGRPSSSPYFALGVGGGGVPPARRRRASGQTTTTMALSQSLAKSQIPAASTPFNRTTDRRLEEGKQGGRIYWQKRVCDFLCLPCLPASPANPSPASQSLAGRRAVHVRSPSVSLSLRCTRLPPDDVTRSCSSNTHAFAVPSPDDDEISQKSADLECGDLS